MCEASSWSHSNNIINLLRKGLTPRVCMGDIPASTNGLLLLPIHFRNFNNRFFSCSLSEGLVLTLLNFFLQKNVSPWNFLYLSILQTELVKKYSLVDKLQDFSLAVNVKVSYVAIQNAKKLKSPYPNLTV